VPLKLRHAHSDCATTSRMAQFSVRFIQSKPSDFLLF
jgi:hypothetical protein